MYFEYGNLLLTRIPLGVQYFSLSLPSYVSALFLYISIPLSVFLAFSSPFAFVERF